MSDRLKPNGEGLYQKTEWNTGDIITKPKMMNIEDWLASATDELMEARTGHTILRDINTWNNLNERFEYLTSFLSIMSPEGAENVIAQLDQATENTQQAITTANEAIEEANKAYARATSAAELIENMTVVAQTLPEGESASVLQWEEKDGGYYLNLGIPAITIAVGSTETVIDGTTNASVEVAESGDMLTRYLDFTIPAPLFSVSSEIVDSGVIAADVIATDLNTLNPKLKFQIPIRKYSINSTAVKTTGSIEASVEEINPNTLNPGLKFTIPVSTPELGTITTTSTGNIISDNIVTLSDTNTLTPKFNFNIPVQKIVGVEYTQAIPGQTGDFEIKNASTLNPTLALTLPVQNISEVVATARQPGQDPTASLEYIDNDKLNLRLNLGLPLARPLNITKTYLSLTELQNNIHNEVPIGDYCIIANENSYDINNGKIYISTETSPYYAFIADIAAATPDFQIGTISAVNADQTASASIDATDPTAPILSLTIPAKPIFTSTSISVVGANNQALASVTGSADDLALSLTVPAIPVFQNTVNVTNNPSVEARATASITGTPDNLVLNLNFPPDLTTQVATKTQLGSIKVGDTLKINDAGVLDVDATESYYSFSFATTDWILDNNEYSITKTVTDITEETKVTANLGDTYYNLKSSLTIQTTNSGTIIFKTARLPNGIISGNLYVEKISSGGVI